MAPICSQPCREFRPLWDINTIFKSHPQGVILEVYAQPNGKKTELLGLHGERLKIRIKGQPVDGKANAELVDFLSEQLKTSKSQIQILRGETSREKSVLINGISESQIKSLLKLLG